MKKFLLSLTVFLTLFSSIKATNYYWIGGAGAASTSLGWTDGTRWSYTSGGAAIGGLVSISSVDDVFFDDNSHFPATPILRQINLIGSASCHKFSVSLTTVTSCTLQITGNYRMDIYGDENISISGTSSLYSVGYTDYQAT